MNSDANLHYKAELVRRSQVGGPFHILISLVYFLLFADQGTHPWLWTGGLIFAGLTGLLRLVVHRGSNPDKNNMNTYFLLHTGLALSTALVWGTVAAYSVDKLGLGAPESLTSLVLICGILSGALYTLSPIPWVANSFILFVLAPIGFNLTLYPKSKFESSVSLMLAIYGAYLWIISNTQTKALHSQTAAESSLRLKNEKIQQVINSVPGFVFTIDKELRVYEKSSDLNYLLGDSFQANSDNQLFGREHMSLITTITDFRQSKITESTQEINLGNDERANWFLLSLSKNPLLLGEIVVVGIPIHELKDAQDMVKTQTSKAEYSARLATLGEMAAGIAHEVNNPLAVIMGASSQIERLLGQEPFPKEVVLAKAKKIVATCQRIGKIIQGLRSFSRQGEHDSFLATSVKQLVEDTLELCRERFYNNGINIIIDPIPDVQIPARAVQLSQVLINLLNNAFDAMQSSSEKFVKFQFVLTDETISILVSDSGPGIPEVVAKRIFDPFFTTKEIGKGTGLGLSISKGIIEDHQGELILHRDQRLTLFEIKLPLQHKETITLKKAG